MLLARLHVSVREIHPGLRLLICALAGGVFVRVLQERWGAAQAAAFGWIVASHQIGAGVGALGAGLIRSSLTTYTPAWVAAGAICIVAAVIVLRIGRRAPRLGLAPAAAE